ncbi:MAG: NAD(P)-dependent alcohol dehydrogenase [Woeseiaceae bacterium]
MKLRYKIINGFLAFLGVAIIALAITLSYTSDCTAPPGVVAGADTMKAVVSRCYGGPEALEYLDVEKPQPGPKDVIVRIEAAAVNPLDYHYMRGSPYLMRLASGIGSPNDSRMGVDFAGVVVEAGDEVTKFAVGDAVFGGRSGAFAEYLVIPEDRAIATKPDNVSFEEAAAIPIAAVTALQALRDSGRLQAGEKVLINGASGGVGTYTVQIAKALGAEVHGVCSTRNVEMVRALGADHVFDYKNENYTESDNEYDLIVDMVGNQSLTANRRVLKPNGRMVLVGGPKGNWVAPLGPPLKAMLLSKFIDQEIGVMLAKLTGDDLEYLAGLMADGRLTSRIDTRYPLSDTAEALRYLETRRARGKVIIAMNGSDHGKPLDPDSRSADPASPSDDREKYARLAIETLSEELAIASDDIEVVHVSIIDWPDSSLGCPQPGVQYLQAVTRGSVVLLRANNKVHRVHVGKDHAVVCDTPFQGGLPASSDDLPGKSVFKVMQSAREDLAGRLGVAFADVTVTEMQSVVWPNSALGCPVPDQAYTDAEVPGFRITLEHDGRSFEYHTDDQQVIPCPAIELK